MVWGWGCLADAHPRRPVQQTRGVCQESGERVPPADASPDTLVLVDRSARETQSFAVVVRDNKHTQGWGNYRKIDSGDLGLLAN